ncbi:MAG: hypothetical protein HY976_01215 [Candidatus Kerfeldbacteria bacterium]|nr:hypothetical protein [Candidatus Kerfeldbacteria bacterium]
MTVNVPLPSNSRVALQRAGYAAFRDPRTGSESYVRRLSNGFYPRFHLYAEERGAHLQLNLHLDQKQPSYGGGSHMHSGEYDGSTVEREMARLLAALPAAN